MSKEEYLKRFFGSDGKTVILPIDHGTAISIEGLLRRPSELIEEVDEYVDGYVVNYGVAAACSESLSNSGICLRTDCYKPTYPGNPDDGSYVLYSAEDADALGAHAMMNMLYLHHRKESDNYRECAAIISEGREYGIPVILEALPFNIGRADEYTVENIGFAARLAAELGADVVKTAFPANGSVDEFKAIVEAAIVPVVVLGGAAMGDDPALLKMVKDAIDAGASGIAIGRNVWQHNSPKKMAAAMEAIVHGGDSVDAALKLLR